MEKLTLTETIHQVNGLQIQSIAFMAFRDHLLPAVHLIVAPLSAETESAFLCISCKVDTVSKFIKTTHNITFTYYIHSLMNVS